jgi:hypothetical protein
MSLTAAKALRDRPNRAAAMVVVTSFMVYLLIKVINGLVVISLETLTVRVITD